MGFRTSWVAVAALSLAEMQEALGLRATGEKEDCTDVGYSGITLPPWSVIVADGSAHFMSLGPNDAKNLSTDREAVFFLCNDTTMTTQVSKWADGNELWRIGYTGLDGPGEAKIVGSLPDELGEIIQEAAREQANDQDVDYVYDAVADVAKAVVGFRHDEEPETEADDTPVHVLQKV